MSSVLSTKKLKPNQRALLLGGGLTLIEYNAIKIKPVIFTLPRKLKNIIITSQNGAKAYINTANALSDKDIMHFVVGNKTTALLERNGLKVARTAQNGEELARFIVKNYKDESFVYFCGDKRRDELPTILKEGIMAYEEVVAYETQLNRQKFARTFEGILFYSPSGVQSYVAKNVVQTTAFCIGETTASEARIYFKNVVVSNATTIESTIAKAVKYLTVGL